MYLDGNFVNSQNIPGTLVSSNYDLVIGARSEDLAGIVWKFNMF